MPTCEREITRAQINQKLGLECTLCEGDLGKSTLILRFVLSVNAVMGFSLTLHYENEVLSLVQWLSTGSRCRLITG